MSKFSKYTVLKATESTEISCYCLILLHYSNFPHGLENWVTLPDFEAREALFQLGLAGRPFNKNIDYNHWHM